MAVRRISDLPNIEIAYSNASLSDCLYEVSYAKPGDPRRYQSFYQNGSNLIAKVASYLTNSTSFITPADLSALGIGDIAELVNMLNSLLNTEDLYLFVAQCGIPYNVTTTGGNLQYDIVTLTNASNSKIGKTLVWKVNPSAFDTSFNSTYYTAQKHDIIFFKTINDAMKVAQRFKFLEGAGIKIKICTDLVEPLHVDYSLDTSTNKVTINSVTPFNSTLSHSDMCEIEVSGTKIKSLVRSYDRTTKSIAYCKIDLEDAIRTIFRDTYSLYNSRYNYMIKSALSITYRCLVFDGGIRYPYGDIVTLDNRCLETGTAGTAFNCVAFMNHDYSVIGNSFTLNNCSFNKCHEALRIVGGYRSMVNGMIEILNCDNSITVTEAGSAVRNYDVIGGYIYLNKASGSSNFFLGSSNAIILLNTAVKYEPYHAQQFMYASTKSSYSPSDWRYVTYNEMSAYINSNLQNQTSLQNYAVNPNYNAFIVDIGGARQSLGIDSSTNDFSNFLRNTTGNIAADTLTSNCTYTGYTKNYAFLNAEFDLYQQTVVTYSNLYNDYNEQRFNSNSRLRSAIAFTGNTSLTRIWDYQYYQNRFRNDGQLTSNVNANMFRVTVENEPGSSSITREYSLLNNAFTINPNEYSLKDYRRNDSTYSFSDITNQTTFQTLLNSMRIKYGYYVTKS